MASALQVAICTAVANILTLPENDEVLVVGTVYKDMKLKPSILDEYVKVCQLRYRLIMVLETCCDRLHVLQAYVHLLRHSIAFLLGDSDTGVCLLARSSLQAECTHVVCRTEERHSLWGVPNLLELMTASFWRMRVLA